MCDVVGKILKEVWLQIAALSLLFVCFPVFNSRVTFNSLWPLWLLFGTLFDLLSNLNKQINLYLREEEMEKQQREWFKSKL